MPGGKNMKRIMPIVLVGVLVLSGFGVSAISEDSNEENVVLESIVFSEPTIHEHDQYVKVHLDEATSYLREPGNPLLPVYTKLFTFPFGTTIKDVSYTFSSVEELQLSKEVIPASEPTPVSSFKMDIKEEVRIKNNEIYSNANMYPETRFNYHISAGLDDNVHVVFVAIQYSPIVYSPKKNILYYSPEATIKIMYEPSRSMIHFSDEYDLVVIAPSEFTASMQPLIQHKNTHALTTTLMTTEEIYSEYSGRDEAEKIKYFIKDALETLGVDYVMLVGSIYKLPMRISKVSLWNFESDTLTDLYYADIYDEYGEFSSWDTNNNDDFGENEDDVDLYPDVHVGRLPCDSIEEVEVVVDKIVHYETETYGQDWFYDIIFIGGNTFPNFWSPGNEGEENNEIVMEIMSDFDPTIIWTSLRNFNKKTINNAISEGAGFLDYSGHGFEHGMGTYPPHLRRLKCYLTPSIKDLDNGYKLPIMFFDACLTAKLDFVLQDVFDYKEYRVFNFLAKILNIDTSVALPVFAYYFLKHAGGGAIATIGATRTAYGGVDSGAGKMSIEFFSAYESSEMLGQMMTQAQNEYITDVPNDAFTVEEFALLGDPSLMIGGYP
jgi:hypothetical protein